MNKIICLLMVLTSVGRAQYVSIDGKTVPWGSLKAVQGSWEVTDVQGGDVIAQKFITQTSSHNTTKFNKMHGVSTTSIRIYTGESMLLKNHPPGQINNVGAVFGDSSAMVYALRLQTRNMRGNYKVDALGHYLSPSREPAPAALPVWIYDCGVPVAVAPPGQDPATVAAFKKMLANAEKGVVADQYHVGNCYLLGRGCGKNQPEGMKWLQKAADGGSLEASNKLAELKKE